MTQFITVKNSLVVFTVTAENFSNERIAQLIKLAKRDYGKDIITYIITLKDNGNGASIGDNIAHTIYRNLEKIGAMLKIDTAINIVRKLLNKKGSQTYKYYLTTILKYLKYSNTLIIKGQPFIFAKGATITEITHNSIMTVNSLNNLFCTDEKPENAFAVFD